MDVTQIKKINYRTREVFTHTHTHLYVAPCDKRKKKKHMNPPGKKNKIPYFHILFFHIRIKVVRVCVVLILYWHISDEHDDDMNSDY